MADRPDDADRRAGRRAGRPRAVQGDPPLAVHRARRRLRGARDVLHRLRASGAASPSSGRCARTATRARTGASRSASPAAGVGLGDRGAGHHPRRGVARRPSGQTPARERRPTNAEGRECHEHRRHRPPRTGTTGGGGFAIARVVRLIAAWSPRSSSPGSCWSCSTPTPANDIVNALLDAARWLVGPFKGIFNLDSHKATVAVNWGLAALVYCAIGHLIARLLAR